MGADKRQGRQRRNENIKKLLPTKWIIFCNGEKTEPNYFNKLIEYLYKQQSTQIANIKYFNESPSNLISRFESYRQTLNTIPINEKIIFVFDKDNFDDFDNAIKLANRKYPGCFVAWSNICFELWLCLHFELYTSTLTSAVYNSKLTTKLGENYERKLKNNERLFNLIIENDGSLEIALKNAKKLMENKNTIIPSKSNPATTVHIAVSAILDETKNT